MSWLPRHASPLRTQLPTTLAQYTDLGLVPTRILVVLARIRLLPSPLGMGDAVVARYGAEFLAARIYQFLGTSGLQVLWDAESTTSVFIGWLPKKIGVQFKKRRAFFTLWPLAKTACLAVILGHNDSLQSQCCPF